MATPWHVAGIGWCITVLGWLLSPIIGLLLPKIMSCLGFDASQKLRELEIHIIPVLKRKLCDVEEQKMLREARKDKATVKTLDTMGGMLKTALYEAEDILDVVDYHRMEKKVVGDGESHGSSCLKHLYGAVVTCIARCNRSWLGRCARIIRSRSAPPLQWAKKSLCWLLRRSDAPLPMSSAPSNSLGRWLCSWSRSFDFNNCCRSIFNWLAEAIEVARSYRNWSYDVVGITSHQENATALDSFLPAISRWNLKKRTEKVESTVDEVKKSHLLNLPSSSAPNDISNINRSKIRSTSKQKVFGREALRHEIMEKMFGDTPHGDAPSSSTSRCYSVIGIHGVAGSGKTTLARYVLDYIKECHTERFDTTMCIHMSETYSMDDIFHDMLKDITNDRHSNISCREELENKLKETLTGKRFFLVLDDLCVKGNNYQQLKELLSPLDVGMEGSKILVTGRREAAVRALVADELIAISDLDEEQYFDMFMHYALDGTSDHDRFKKVGKKIVAKLHKSPIAAVIVAGQLRGKPYISFWETTADLDVLNETIGALWWSYLQLDADIRRCFEYCNIFPRRYELERDELVRMWVAQGFVCASATEDMEDVGRTYVEELLSCSFLQLKRRSSSIEYLTIHDLLRDLADKVAGSDYFRIENGSSQIEEELRESWTGDVPPSVRHLFVQSYDGELITDKILKLENLRTLIIYNVGLSTPVEERVIESIFKTLQKLRVLVVAFRQEICAVISDSKMLSVPECISQLKHVRYLAFRTYNSCRVILPSTLSKLYHMQLVDFVGCQGMVFPSAGLINLRHVFCLTDLKFPNMGRLTSLQTIPDFTVRNEQGYEVKQLRDLNKLRGNLWIKGLENVESKEEALEANLAAKERLTLLSLVWDRDTRCSPEVEAEVLEGLRPPVGLGTLCIRNYKGSRYPNWMVGEQEGDPNDLHTLNFLGCSQLGPGPELGAFIHLRSLMLLRCGWNALPGNMEQLTSLKELEIYECLNICKLPTLPQSLEYFTLDFCNYELMRSCRTKGHPNWQKIEHIPNKKICRTMW